jgi:hypothetical protein
MIDGDFHTQTGVTMKIVRVLLASAGVAAVLAVSGAATAQAATAIEVAPSIVAGAYK